MTKQEIENAVLEYLVTDAKKRGMPSKIFHVVWERQAREVAEILTATA